MNAVRKKEDVASSDGGSRLALLLILGLVAGGLAGVGWAQTAPTDVRASDAPNDDGGRGLIVRWSYEPAKDEPAAQGFLIYRSAAPDGDLKLVTPKPLPPDARSYQDTDAAPPKKGRTNLRERATAYSYSVRAVYGPAFDEATPVADSAMSNPARARSNWFHGDKWVLLLATLLFGALLTFLTFRARRGHVPTIRRIPGLEAVDEAIGRATEMGRPILYISGIGDVSDVATIASINILSHVAKRSGEFGMRMRVPCRDPIVMQVLRTVAEQSYLDIGRPDAYHPEDVFFLTESQFAYAAAVDGIMVREKPAAVFLQGVFYAESLILAETANSVGAIQIAGTDRDAQLPFFIAACDYTLIGEELFAASAYLSDDAQLLSTIRSQDLAKLVVMGLLVLGVLLELGGVHGLTKLLETAIR